MVVRLEKVFMELSEQYYAKLIKSIKNKRVILATPFDLTNEMVWFLIGWIKQRSSASE